MVMILFYEKKYFFMQPFTDLQGIIYERGEKRLKKKEYSVPKEDIVEKYFNMVYKLALSQTKNKTSADDVVQEVFLRYIRTNTEFDSEEHVKAWLIRVTLNCAKNTFSNSWFQKTVPLTEEIVFESKENGDVYYAVLELPKKYRAVIHLFYYEELSVSQIAEYLKTKESTVKSQLHRGRKMLKERLKGGFEDV